MVGREALLRRIVELGRGTAASDFLRDDAPALRKLYLKLRDSSAIDPVIALRVALAAVTHRTTRLALEELVEEVRR